MALYVVPKYTTRGRWLSFYGWQQMALYVVPKKVLRGSLLDHHFLRQMALERGNSIRYKKVLSL
jgi:hypothetical protein